MNIGDFAAKTGLSVSAVRFYGGRGLLPPADIDEASGYRLYGAEQIATGRLIRDLRRMEMPLTAIEQVLILPAHERRQALEAHLTELEGVLRRAKGIAMHLNNQPLPEEDSMSTSSAINAVLPSADFGKALDQVLPASGDDPRRPHLMGVLIEGREGSIRLVATDGHRCVVRDLVPVRLITDFSVVVAAATLKQWQPHVPQEGEVSLTVDDRMLDVGHGSIKISLERIPTTFPPYEKILHPADDVLKVTADRQTLLAAFESFAEQAVVTVELTGADLVLSDGTAQRRLPAEVPTSHHSFALNASYAADALRHAVGAEVFIDVEDPLKPLIFRCADDGTYTSLLMPVKV